VDLTQIVEYRLLRSTYLQCTEPNCGATFRGGLEVTHKMSPSTCPNPDVELPEADQFIRQAAINNR